ncbi:MAG: hypothetical protein EKK40_15535 [Bradyrhizobiaceae bacterium]|nr:MAG: hypothetical protein EKK40_15535 [Bradyrhizobiaceae bacterium]
MQELTPTRNLLIVQTPDEQDPADWIAVKQRIETAAPDIEVAIANNRNRNSVTARWQVRRPSLVFSPVRLIDFVPRGGTVYCGHVLGKNEQMRRLSAIGVPTPRTEMLSRQTAAAITTSAGFGEYVIVKPNNMNSGVGVRLVRTADLVARYDELTASAHDQLLVEPYIDHSDDNYPSDYRILIMFGQPLYCVYSRWVEKRRPLSEIAADPDGIIASNAHTPDGRARALTKDPEVLSLASRCQAAFPECPVLGVDIIRDSQTGELYVLEVNPHGAVWHLSSPYAKTMDPDHVRQRYAQFNALDRIAELLIEKTRTEAS